ncbi:MAG: TIM barrel protein [Chloroflexota bacterium]|nr:TIM barrel protein [Chloroflexota bacterium]
MRLGVEVGKHSHDVAVEHGIKGVPISADQLVKDGLDRTLAPLNERGLQVCQIGAFGFNPLSVDADAQAKQTETLAQAIPLAADTGCPYIVINGGNYHPSGFGAADARNFADDSLRRVAEALKPLLDSAEKHGAKLSIEAYLKTAVNSPETFLRLKELAGGSEALRCNIDVTSLYNYQDLWDPAPKVQHICNGLAGHYGLGHVKGVALKDGFHIHVELAPITEDSTDWSQMLRLMAPHMPDDSWLILEHMFTPEEARASLAMLRKAAEEAGLSLE